MGPRYAMVSWSPAANRNLVVLGALGKACAAVLVSAYALADRVPNSIFLFGVADLAFALLFAVFLGQTRQARSAA